MRQDQIKYALGLQQIQQGVGILPEKLFGLNVVIADGALTNTAPSGAAVSLRRRAGGPVCEEPVQGSSRLWPPGRATCRSS